MCEGGQISDALSLLHGKEAFMKQGSSVELIMKKILRVGTMLDQKTYLCKILMYDIKQECIYLILENGSLPEISLDAIYECMIEQTEEMDLQEQPHKMVCTGRVRDRYYDEHGQILKFEIENGFYKINIKSVDK